MENIAVKIENLSMRFKAETVLRHITHSFEAGKIHGIVGNNGSGKTVLFKCICGFLIPTEGRVFVRGKQVGREVDFPGSLGIIIETPGFLAGASGFKNLKILASLKGEISDEKIRECIRRVGLDPALKKPVGKYSLGMRQRLGIAQAIMEDPGLLVLDEPLNGLDKEGVRDMRSLIKDQRSAGKTVLLASHNASDIEELCDTVCEMDAGVLTLLEG
jgi:ABC-2 type transport system ATP-binding protein